jgi:hypothetical protein
MFMTQAPSIEFSLVCYAQVQLRIVETGGWILGSVIFGWPKRYVLLIDRPLAHGAVPDACGGRLLRFAVRLTSGEKWWDSLWTAGVLGVQKMCIRQHKM